MWIDDHCLGLLGIALSGKGIEAHRHALGVMFNATEVSLQELPDRELAFLRNVDELAIFLNKQIQAVGLKSLLGQRVLGRKFVLNVV